MVIKSLQINPKCIRKKKKEIALIDSDESRLIPGAVSQAPCKNTKSWEHG